MTTEIIKKIEAVLGFVSNVQKRIDKEKDDLNIPRKQKRPIAKPLAQIAGQADGRNAAIIAAYATGAYSQARNW